MKTIRGLGILGIALNLVLFSCSLGFSTVNISLEGFEPVISTPKYNREYRDATYFSDHDLISPTGHVLSVPSLIGMPVLGDGLWLNDAH